MGNNNTRFLVHAKHNACFLDVLIRTLIHNCCLYRVLNISLCLCKRRSLRCHATDYSDAFVIRDIIFHQPHEFLQFYETKSWKRKIIRLKLYVYLPTEARRYKAEYTCVYGHTHRDVCGRMGEYQDGKFLFQQLKYRVCRKIYVTGLGFEDIKKITVLATSKTTNNGGCYTNIVGQRAR